jgi:hypothetical protein
MLKRCVCSNLNLVKSPRSAQILLVPANRNLYFVHGAHDEDCFVRPFSAQFSENKMYLKSTPGELCYQFFISRRIKMGVTANLGPML